MADGYDPTRSVKDLAAVSAIVLAGGRSSRMGRPKALLLLDGEPMIGRIVRRLARHFFETIVVTAPDGELPAMDARVVRDEVEHQGPAGGICYGLAAASQEVCFVTSCDAPFLSFSLASFLTSQIAGYDAVVPLWQGRYQPLHAAYRRDLAALFRESLAAKELRLASILERVRCRVIGEEEIRRFDPQGRALINVNSPEEYRAAASLARTRRKN